MNKISFPTWKRITLGTGPKTVKAFHQILQVDFRVGDSADGMLDGPGFTVVSQKVTVELLRLSVPQLTGKEDGVTNAEIFAGADRLGLSRCPPEVGPRLRVQYKDQESGEWLVVGMDPIPDASGRPCIFGIACDGSGLLLLGHLATPERFWSGDRLWVFMRKN